MNGAKQPGRSRLWGRLLLAACVALVALSLASLNRPMQINLGKANPTQVHLFSGNLMIVYSEGLAPALSGFNGSAEYQQYALIASLDTSFMKLNHTFEEISEMLSAEAQVYRPELHERTGADDVPIDMEKWNREARADLTQMVLKLLATRWFYVHLDRQAPAEFVLSVNLLLPFGLLSACGILYVVRRRVVLAGRLRRGECVQCGYDRRGSAGDTCPECGWATENVPEPRSL